MVRIQETAGIRRVILSKAEARMRRTMVKMGMTQRRMGIVQTKRKQRQRRALTVGMQRRELTLKIRMMKMFRIIQVMILWMRASEIRKAI